VSGEREREREEQCYSVPPAEDNLEIRSESVIRYPRDRVYRTYRDQLPEMAAFIPDVDRVVVVSRKTTEYGLELHNEWIAAREVPSYARAFVKAEHLRWDDYAEWHDDDFRVDWRIGTRVFTEAVHCVGVNRFFEHPEGTKVVLSGELKIDLSKVSGFPRFLAARVGPEVERFVVSLITPNLEQVNASIGRFLDAQG
jgi:hypothetical protein